MFEVDAGVWASLVGSVIGAAGASIVVWIASQRALRSSTHDAELARQADRQRQAVIAGGQLIASLASASLRAQQFRLRNPNLAPRVVARLYVPFATTRWLDGQTKDLAAALEAHSIVYALSSDTQLLTQASAAVELLQEVALAAMRQVAPPQSEWDDLLIRTGVVQRELRTSLQRLTNSEHSSAS